jgi:hypothetical protein
MPRIIAVVAACTALAACDVATQTTAPPAADADLDMASPGETGNVDTSIFEAVPAQP